MWYVALVIIISSIPYIWVLWSLIDVRNGKRETVNKKGPLIAFFIILAASVIINFYLKSSYNYSLFPTSRDLMIGGIVLALFAFVFAIVLFITNLSFRGAPKSVHNPAAVMKLFAGMLAAFVLVFGWYYPIGEKLMHAQLYDYGEKLLAQQADEQEFSLVLISSDQECLDYRSSSCRSSHYKNVMMVKNNLDMVAEVELKIRALNESGEEIAVIDSDILTLKPEQVRVVTTPQSHEGTSEWKVRSFNTEDPVYQFQYVYRYRRAEG